MQFQRFRRRFTYVNYKAPKISPWKKSVLVLIGFLLILCILFVIVSSNLRPVAMESAVASTTDVITEIVNRAIQDKMTDGALMYDDLVTLEKDTNGNVTALVTDIHKVNAIQSEITNMVIDRLAERKSQVEEIPLGNLIGGALFSGRGPKIPVKILSVTSVSSAFRNDFSAAGINQTCHRIMLTVYVNLTILIPGSTKDITVETEVAIAETVIVGTVPGTYANFGS